jgi:hypothetical protein
MREGGVYFGGSDDFDEKTGKYRSGRLPGKKGSRGSREDGMSYIDLPIPINIPVMPGPGTVAPFPIVPPINFYKRSGPVQIPTPDLVITGEAPEPIDGMIDLVFEKIGGHELISISRSENVNGQNISYQPIKNMGELSKEYDTKKIIPLPNSSAFYDNSFAIKIESKIPEKGLGFTGVDNDDSLNIYVSYTPGVEASKPKLIIEAANLAENERIQVEIIKSSDVFSDTDYHDIMS